MDWHQIGAKWRYYKAKVPEYWGRITDEDLETIGGRRERLAGLIQERYGVARTEAEGQIEAFLARKKTAARL